MKKTLVLLTLTIMVSTYSFAQVRPKIGGAKADSISFKDDNWATWATGISQTLAGNSTRKLVTEYAVKDYLSTFAPAGINVSVDSLADTTAVHNTRLKVVEAARHTHSNSAILNATTASFTTAQGTAISTSTTKNGVQDDTLTSHNTRIKANRTSVIDLDLRVGSLEANPVGDLNLTGTPVTYQVPFFASDDSTLTTTTLYYKNTNLGVDVSNPLNKIHQDGGTATANYHQFTVGNTTGQTGTDGILIGADETGKGWIKQQEALDFGFMINTTERMALETDGIKIRDDIYYENFVPVTAFGYMYIDSATSQCLVDSSYILGAAGLTTEMPSIASLLKETNSAGEIRWPFPNYEGGVDWIFPTRNMQYGITLSSHQVMMEIILRKVDELERKNEDLEDRLSEEAKYRESLEKRFNQLQKDVSLLKHKSLKRRR